MKKTRLPLNQKSRFKSGSALIAAVALVAFGYAAVRIFAASGSGSLYLTPAIGTYAPGQAVNVQVYTNTGGDPVNAVQSDFSYPSAKLQFVSIDGTGSAFPLDAAHSGGSGTVSIARSTSGGGAPVSGVGLIATVHFTALAAGSASLTFLNSSHVVRSTDNADILTTTTGAAYTIAVAATPTPTPPHTPTPAPGHTATPTAKPVGSTTPSPTSSAVAAAGSTTPSPSSSSASPSASAQPQSSSSVVTVPTTKVPKRVDVLGVKVAGIPVLALAVVIVLAATAGVVFTMNRYHVSTNVSSSGSPQNFAPTPPVTPTTPTTPPAPSTPETPAPPTPASDPAPASQPETPGQSQPSSETSESQDKETT